MGQDRGARCRRRPVLVLEGDWAIRKRSLLDQYRIKLGEMATRARAARLLTLDAAGAFDRGERCDLEAGMAKYFSTEAALENSIESMRIHGAYGYSKEYDIERLYRDAPLTVIGEGTNEIQRIIIAKQWLIEARKSLREAKIPYKQVAFVHDEVQIETPEAYGEKVGEIMVAAAKTAGEVLGFRCPVGAEFKIGRNWAECH